MGSGGYLAQPVGAFGALAFPPDKGALHGVSVLGSGLGTGLVEIGVGVHLSLSPLLRPKHSSLAAGGVSVLLPCSSSLVNPRI